MHFGDGKSEYCGKIDAHKQVDVFIKKINRSM